MSTKYNPHAGHRARMRDEFLANPEYEDMRQHKILELLLYYAVPRIDTSTIAHDLLYKFGSIKGVLDAPIDALKTINGIGDNAAVLLKLMTAIFREYEKDNAASVQCINSTNDAVDFFRPRFKCFKSEVFLTLFLDKSRRIIKCASIGNSDEVSVDVKIKTLIGDAVACKAVYAILAHNHPGGICVPSRSDKDSTYMISKALNSVNVTVLNHYIISDTEYFSFADSSNFSDCLRTNIP